MSFGKMNGFADIIREQSVKDEDGFSQQTDVVLASVRIYREGRHGSKRWANLAQFTTATDLFRFRKIPGIDIFSGDVIVCDGGRFVIDSVENVKSRGLYIEVLAKKVEAANG